MQIGIAAIAADIVNWSIALILTWFSLAANNHTLARLSGPNITGPKAALNKGAAVAIRNSTPTILAVFLGFIISRWLTFYFNISGYGFQILLMLP
jgi:hypothetical protein